ncbi:DUF1540 domain-containing protein [Paenibacillus sp. 481]|nr:DUF1540 domain-containing protein [Paenibacillus sp. 481]UHA74152.1 DUF1540 domain-containing protein [Paenibacillus sp. 481]
MAERPVVHCSIANCKFWGDFRCHAEQIVIEIDAHARTNVNEEFADELGGPHKDCAPTSAATCCQTFKPKDDSSCPS